MLTEPKSKATRNVIAMTPRRTEFAVFILEILDFMEEKIREAHADENSRIAALGEAAGAVPVLRDRLREDELVQTKFIMVFGNELYDPHATGRWRDLAQMPRADFEAEAEAFIKPDGVFAALRRIAEATKG
ncbi:hypothetical protein [Bradyrhizobium sp. CCBAU 53380]|uniref:hypothetical protein n=1 Tax=Bradyrhizobium sp. CCBAU 53380 TaxID=1325117 RepID=UPI0023027BD2|nr:hypothetical protein [Bradyrhizobium sp. CCBAU 53380]MDA9420976.1 hypothetical protein [Bradyrhizobium sp. CCBAU 53380]